MDAIDRSCMEFKQCYKCLLEEHKSDTGRECRGEDLGYRMELTTDADGKKVIKCDNPKDSCRYNICQCDKALAEKLAMYESEWDETLHSVKGGFDREDKCHRMPPNNNPFVECCGDTSTFPFNQPRHESQCCDGPVAKQNGQCN